MNLLVLIVIVSGKSILSFFLLFSMLTEWNAILIEERR